MASMVLPASRRARTRSLSASSSASVCPAASPAAATLKATARTMRRRALLVMVVLAGSGSGPIGDGEAQRLQALVDAGEDFPDAVEAGVAPLARLQERGSVKLGQLQIALCARVRLRLQEIFGRLGDRLLVAHGGALQLGAVEQRLVPRLQPHPVQDREAVDMLGNFPRHLNVANWPLDGGKPLADGMAEELAPFAERALARPYFEFLGKYRVVSR